MKKLIALLLVIGIVMSLGACKKPAQEPGGSTGQTEKPMEATGKATKPTENKTEPSTDTTGKTDAPTEDINKPDTPTEGTKPADTSTEATGTTGVHIPDNSDLINPEKFGGKKLEIYGYAYSPYYDITNMEDGSIGWMIRAAADEWAALNNVEIDFEGNYDQSIILGDIGAGGKPDLLLYCDKIPVPELTYIVKHFSEAEYKELARTCGPTYLDLTKHQRHIYGVQHPWGGGKMLQYNKTLFEQNGIKSPGEYFIEDNWNWDTFETCMTEISKVPGVYPTGNLKALIPEFYYRELDEDGFLSSTAEESKEFARFMEIYNNLKDVCPEQKTDWDTTATAFQDILWYDYADMHQVLENGDVIEAVPVPKFSNDSVSFYNHNTAYSAILSSCDEPEAALALLNYILRVGMRYMSDYSLGLYKCNYEGIRGATAYSQAWKNKIAEILAQRQTEFDKLTDWDHELYLKTQAYIFEAEQQFPTRDYPNEWGVNPRPADPHLTIPPTSVEYFIIIEKAWIEVYNELYIWQPG